MPCIATFDRRPRRISDEQRDRIVAVAGARPENEGSPHTRWSLRRLSEHLAGEGIAVSAAHLGRVLAQAGLSFQRTRSWKASPDPDYEAKAERVIALRKRAPEDGVVIAFDQMGPHSLRPTPGSGWARRKRPERQRGDFNRRHGIRYVFGAYDVHADRLRTRLRPHRRGTDVLAFMRQIRLCYPRRVRIYWIQDNLSANWTPAIQETTATGASKNSNADSPSPPKRWTFECNVRTQATRRSFRLPAARAPGFRAPPGTRRTPRLSARPGSAAAA